MALLGDTVIRRRPIEYRAGRSVVTKTVTTVRIAVDGDGGDDDDDGNGNCNSQPLPSQVVVQHLVPKQSAAAAAPESEELTRGQLSSSRSVVWCHC